MARLAALSKRGSVLFAVLVAFACLGFGWTAAPGGPKHGVAERSPSLASSFTHNDFVVPDRFTEDSSAAIPEAVRRDLSRNANVRFVARDIDHDGDIDLLAFTFPRLSGLTAARASVTALWLNNGGGVFQKASYRTFWRNSINADAPDHPGNLALYTLFASFPADEDTPQETFAPARVAFRPRAPVRLRSDHFSAPYWVLPRHTVSPLNRRGPPSALPLVALTLCVGTA